MSLFFPNEYVDSTYSINFEEFYKAGYRGVIFDIDNTLVPHGAPADERAIHFFASPQFPSFIAISASRSTGHENM